ncbi:MAG: hypothetical protein HYT97_06990 [Elusimicrobia bacterium]|nr:hypothetical protein [Elusimicrobiota bacterium]
MQIVLFKQKLAKIKINLPILIIGIHLTLFPLTLPKILADSKKTNLSQEKEYGPYDEVGYLTGLFRFAFTYKKNGKEYLNVGGKNYGPYDYLHFGDKLKMKDLWGFLYMQENKKEFSIIVNDKEFGPFLPPEGLAPDLSFQIAQKHWGVLFVKNQESYVLIDGKNEYGPFQKVEYYSIDQEGWRFLNIKDKTFFVHVNGKEFGPFPAPGVKEFLFLPTFEVIGKNWSVTYLNEDYSWNLVINGKLFGPFREESYQPGSLTLSNNGYGFIFKKNNEWYYQINGKEKKAGENEDQEYKILKEDYSKSFSKETNQEPSYSISIQPYLIAKEKNNYVALKGITYGPFATIKEEAFLTPTYWAFSYTKELNSDHHYVMINGKEYGPFSEDDFRFMRLQVTPTHWGFEMEKENQLFLVFDGQEYGPYDTVNYTGELMLGITNTNFGFAYNKKNGSYVQINGREYGPGIKDFVISEPYWLIHLQEKGKHFVRVSRGTLDPAKYPIP